MKQDGKIKALKKVIDMLVVPKVNELEPLSGFKIRSVRVELTSFGVRNDEPDFLIYVDLTKEPNFTRATDGVSHLILNVAEYIDPNCELVIYFSEWGSDIEFRSLYAGSSRVFRKTNDISIKMITGRHG
jgi:hypothetical protein